MAGTPNTEGTVNAQVLSGGVFGVIVGNLPTEPVGFYGNPGTTQQTGASAWTTVSQVATALIALGLVAA